VISYFDRKHQSSTVSCRKVLVHRSASVEKIHTCYQRSIVGYAPLSGRKDSVGNFNKSINKRTLQKKGQRVVNSYFNHQPDRKKFHQQPKNGYMAREENNWCGWCRNVNFSASETLTVYGGGIPSTISSRSRSKLSWFVAIDGSELDFTSCGKLPRESDADGPGLSSKSDSGLEA
jgi:hypothetical protein